LNQGSIVRFQPRGAGARFDIPFSSGQTKSTNSLKFLRFTSGLHIFT